MKSALPILAFTAAALASPISNTAATTPGSFKITSVVSGGSGCPQGSIDVDYTNSAVLPIYFGNDFTATVGPNSSADDSRKNCQLNLALQFSPGYQYAVLSADYTGWGQLDAGVKGWVRSNYYFSGQQSQASSSLGITGPFSGTYNKHDDVAISIWSPCGSSAALNIDTEVALTPLNTAASGTLAAVKQNARFTQQLNLQWRQC